MLVDLSDQGFEADSEEEAQGVLMATPYRSPPRWATIDPIWLLLAAVAVLALLSMLGLLRSGSRELLVGLLGGAWICVLAGMAFTLKKREMS